MSLFLYLIKSKVGGVIIESTNYKNIKDWFPIKNIKHNNIYTKDGKCLNVFKVEPINFRLKTDHEKYAILESYKQFLKLCNFYMQIIIQTDRVDIGRHFSRIDKFQKEEPDLAIMADDYKKLIESITKERKSISRKFYIITSNKNSNVGEKLSTSLINCGNVLEECSDVETMQVVKRYLKKNFGIRKEQLRWV